MNRRFGLLAAFAALALSISACTDSTQPLAPQGFVDFGGVGSPSDLNEPTPGILSALDNPLLAVTPRDGMYELTFSAGAGGTEEAPSVVAARSIQLVEFQIFSADGALLDAESTAEVPTTGVTKENGISSLIVFAEIRMLPEVRVEPGAYAIARVHGRGTDLLLLSAPVPTLPND